MTISLQPEDDKILLQWAIGYAKLGWPVLPLHNLIIDLNIPVGEDGPVPICSCTNGVNCPPRNRGKHPRLTRWEERASTDPSQIRSWWAKWPQANIGVACGRAGFLVLDLDTYKSEYDGAELSAAERQTITCLTGGGGRHLWYKMRPEDAFGNSAEGMPPGIDIRAHGGMVVVPPSLHPSRRLYTWMEGLGPRQIEPLPIPASIRAILEAGARQEPKGAKAYTGRRYSPAELEEAMTAAGWAFKRRDRLDKLGRISYDLAACPLSGDNHDGHHEGHDGSALLLFMEGPDKGKPCFICQHNRHQGKGWRDVQLLLFPPGGFHLTDLGNARRLVDKYRDDIRYVVEWKKWIFWTGRYWEVDRTGEIARMGRTIPADIQAEAGKIGDRGLSRKVHKWGLSSESMYHLKAVVNLAREEAGVPIWQGELEADPWLLNVANGVIDLRQGIPVEPRREALMVKCSEVSYDAEATCPRWLAFLREITGGDDELLSFLQRAAGYSLSGSTGEQVWFFLYGGGRNGKSTFINILAELAGGHYLKLPAEAFLQRGLGQSDRIPNDIAQLSGRRLAITAEIDRNRKLAEGLIKDITGGDEVSARFMRGEWFTFRPVCKLWMYGNHKPIIEGGDEGIWRRVRLVPFTVTVAEEQVDRLLAEKLRQELPGILNWALAGCLMWLERGLGMPAAVREATSEYRTEMDEIGDFLESCFDPDPVGRTAAKEIYQVYRGWSLETGLRPQSQRTLGLSLRKRGFEKKRGEKGVIWVGLSLNEEGYRLLSEGDRNRGGHGKY